MLAYVIFAAMVASGYFGAPVWIVLLGAAAVFSEGWGEKLARLRQKPRVPWSTKTTTYFITGILAGIAVSAIGYYAGRLLRVLLG